MAGVLLYNRLQERAARRATERAFGGAARPDVLLEPGVRAAPEPAAAPPRPLSRGNAMPDSRVDYVMHVTLQAPVDGTQLVQPLSALERRFSRRVLLAGSGGEGWRRITAEDAAGRYAMLQAALQLVSRGGVVAESDLLEFRAQTEAFAAGLGGSVAAPEMRQALEAARELDRLCADADIQVALHVVGVEAAGIDVGAQPFACTPRENGLTLSLDVGRTPELSRSYEAMARTASQIAASRGGRLVDDNGRALDERSLATIGARVDALREALAAQGIEPGSPLALRLFS
ncbi:MAG: cell division protein ZipA C-terminal FtsZ-binding domain-containing protein [Betaproteobacteria bacterium]